MTILELLELELITLTSVHLIESPHQTKFDSFQLMEVCIWISADITFATHPLPSNVKLVDVSVCT